MKVKYAASVVSGLIVEWSSAPVMWNVWMWGWSAWLVLGV